jgi:PAS domain S-box-containing protein
MGETGERVQTERTGQARPSVLRAAVSFRTDATGSSLSRARWPAYVFAVVVTGAVLAVRLGFAPWFGERPVLILFLIPIIVSAYLGGVGPGLVSSGIAAFGAKCFLVPNLYSLSFAKSLDVVQWVILGGSGVLISVLSERLHVLRRRAETTIVELKRAQSAARESEQHFRQLADRLPQLVWTSTPDGVCDYLGRQWVEYTGIPANRQLGSAWLQQLHPDDSAPARKAWASAIAATSRSSTEFRTDFHVEFRIRRADGVYRWFDTRALPLRDGSGRIVKWFGSSTDVDERKRAERRLETQNAVSRALAEAASLSEATPRIMKALCDSEGWDFGAIWRVDRQANRLTCAEIWHRPELALDDLVAQTRQASFARGEGLAGQVWQAGEARMVEDTAAAGDAFSRSAGAAAAGLRSALAFPIVVGDEVTGVIDFLGGGAAGPDAKLLEMFETIGRQLGLFFERKRVDAERSKLEAQLQQAQKMEALGQLSGGIAHDFNNVLTAITANVDLALRDTGPDHPAAESLTDAVTACQRARDLVRQILLFTRQQPHERRVVNLASIADESARLLKATFPAGVELVVSLTAGDRPEVLADATQLQQVIVNLSTNAMHALEARGAGHVEISVDTTVVDADRARALVGVRPGRWARLRVHDDGAGIDAAIVDRIFEPFFTTKAPGRGTGLGLSVVHGIVRAHEGAIAVTSQAGAGTTFEIYLPLAPRAVPPRAASPPTLPRGDGQHVLFVDDEESLVASARRALVRAGYQVSGFSKPGDALALYAADPSRFALIVTDMNMPEMSGLQVATEIRKHRPDLPVLLVSGNVTDQMERRASEVGVRKVVHKPWTVSELVEAVQRALGGRGA